MKWMLCKILIHAALFSSLMAPISISTNSSDHEALLALKHQISIDPFLVLSSWNNTLHHCLWQGVICSQWHPQRVLALNLTGLGLVGSISPFMGNLSFLHTINLTNNYFYGHIPQEMGRLFRLRYLKLNNNSIEGQMPLNLTQCRGIKTIDFGFNKLTGKIPIELGSLQNLSELLVASNFLIGTIPSAFGNLSSLTRLDLCSNKLVGHIPEDLAQITTLFWLSLAENNFSGAIPSTLYNLTSMVFFSVVANKLHGSLPANLGNTLPNLRAFCVGGNRLGGSIPVSLCNASRLGRLEFSRNQFSGAIPMSLSKLAALRFLNLERNMLGNGEAEDMGFISSMTSCSLLEMFSVAVNQLRGALPNSIANLSVALEELWLDANQLTGSIPSEIGNLFNLYTLDASDNRLTGIIPASIAKLNRLQYLKIAYNQFSGEIPNSIGNLTNMFRFSVSYNNLQGNIPPSISLCESLTNVYISWCNLSGHLPKQLFEIEQIRILRIEGNSFEGPLPMEVGTVKHLQRFYAYGNKFSGEIPKSLDGCVGLEYLYIGDNFFEGTLPLLSSLRSLLEMDISQNNLSGEIPMYLENFHDLRYLNLSYNDFDGEVPQQGIFENTSAISIVGNQKLCGGNPKLLLQLCASKTIRQKRHKSSRVRVGVIVISSILCFIVLTGMAFVLYTNKRKSHEQCPSSMRSTLENLFLSVSYLDLSKSTNSFSSANLIGTGSYGSVYKGTLDQHNMVVAIKVLNLQHSGAHKSFHTECEALRNIRHRNLLKVLGVCSSIDFKGDEFKALVFEHMENGNLEQWLYPNANNQHIDRNLTFIQRIHIVFDVASALDYLHNCHKKPIVHCDIKPSNVLLDNEMNAHVGDFGLTKFLSEACINSSESHSTSNMWGTIGYVPPEYGLGGEVSTYGDVYSFGILLLELFIGKKPTDEIFNEKLNLHEFAKLALPDRVMEIVDQRLVPVWFEGPSESEIQTQKRKSLNECLDFCHQNWCSMLYGNH